METVTEIRERARRVSRVPASIEALFRSRRTNADDFGRALGISRAAVYKKMRGDAPFTIDEAEAAADYFGVPISALCDGLGGYFGPGPGATFGSEGCRFESCRARPVLSLIPAQRRDADVLPFTRPSVLDAWLAAAAS